MIDAQKERLNALASARLVARAKEREARAIQKDRQRPSRVSRVAEALANRFDRQRHIFEDMPKKRPMTRIHQVKKPKIVKLIAYDFETTRIEAGCPTPLYLTAYGADFHYSNRLTGVEQLSDVLVNEFLTAENNKCRFVAWNGNKFDAYFIASALLFNKDYILKPYMTKNQSLRGVKVLHRETKMHWEFLDGMSMTGIQKPLSAFLKTFAPEYLKLDAPDWEKETFNPNKRKHVAYAERDSEGLYHALIKAQQITLDHFAVPLQCTIGKAGIRVFMQHMPEGVTVRDMPYSATSAVRDEVMRGGYCYCNKKYEGPIWKYDINQAYAAAMREAWLPSDRCYYTKAESRYAKCAVYRVEGVKLGNTIPFYCTDYKTKEKIQALDSFHAWITSLELKQLRLERWHLTVHEGWAWEDGFKMTEYVDKLEDLRVNAPGGSKSAQGEMIKAIGNNSYGKTVERLGGLDIVLSAEKPEGYREYQCSEDEIQHIWFKIGAPQIRDYHQPQLGAFITAHVRMQVRRAILLNPEDWLYADTDCVMFSSKPVGLDIDPARYGAWKVETEGENYRVIAKKVYANFGASEKHSKGLNVKKLTDNDFIDWFNGKAPVQKQVQRQNFIKTMTGADMFVNRTRLGERKIKVEKRLH